MIKTPKRVTGKLFAQGRLHQDYGSLQRDIKSCSRCPLSRTRKNAVPGEGSDPCKVAFVGEAPGEQEDLMGRPFVGPSGALLDAYLDLLGLSPKEVFITNAVRCRPPGNKSPSTLSVQACSSFLQSEILLAKPFLIVALGREAWLALVGKTPEFRRGVGHYRGIPVYGTYHPAAALREPSRKIQIVRDLEAIRARIG